MVHLTPDSSIGDRAEWVELNLSQIGVSGRGLAFLQGPVGVYMIDEVRGGVGAQPGRDDHPGADRAEPPVLRRGVAGLGHGRGRMAP